MPPKPGLLYGAGAVPLLKASSTTLAPLTAGMPKLSAAWPERKLTTPSLKVSCADAGAAANAPATATAMAMRFMVPLLLEMNGNPTTLSGGVPALRRQLSRQVERMRRLAVGVHPQHVHLDAVVAQQLDDRLRARLVRPVVA